MNLTRLGFATYSKYLPVSTWRYLYMTNGNSVISRVWCEMNMRRFSRLTLPVSVNGSSWQVKPGSLLEDLSTARLVSLWCSCCHFGSWEFTIEQFGCIAAGALLLSTRAYGSWTMGRRKEVINLLLDSSKYGTKKVANARQKIPKVRL